MEAVEGISNDREELRGKMIVCESHRVLKAAKLFSFLRRRIVFVRIYATMTILQCRQRRMVDIIIAVITN